MIALLAAILVALNSPITSPIGGHDGLAQLDRQGGRGLGETQHPDTPAAGVLVSGIASHYGASCLEGCLALPQHRWGQPGIRVRVCGPAACIVRTSTDAGPALFRQREGRIADLARNDFERVCGCSWRQGLVRVTVTYLEAGPVPTPPATSTEG